MFYLGKEKHKESFSSLGDYLQAMVEETRNAVFFSIIAND